MKTILKTLLICAAASASTISGFGQGSLTPPGAPAPTMKTLDQVKAGTPITSTPYNITVSGNYFLTGNLTASIYGDGIDVNASGVTIDLNGFTISGVLNNTGISISSACQDITVLNGHITGGIFYSGGNYEGNGFVNGINYGGTGNVRVTGVTVTGVQGNGIYLGNGNSTVVDSCIVNTAGSYGIQADTVSHSTANLCGNTAIFAQNTASDCFGFCTASANGIFTWSNALNCTGGSGSGTGLSANNNAENCVGYSNGSGSALSAGNNASNCYGNNSGNGAGLSTGNNASNCYGYSSGGGYGLHADSNALNCTGSSSSGTGLYANNNAENCVGYTNGTANGLLAYNTENCAGYSNGTGNGAGLYAGYNASNCYGQSNNNGAGLYADNNASNCYGFNLGTGFGLGAGSASNCSGYCSGGIGLTASIASICMGTSQSSGPGLKATIAIGCLGSGSPAYTVTNKYNMP